MGTEKKYALFDQIIGRETRNRRKKSLKISLQHSLSLALFAAGFY